MAYPIESPRLLLVGKTGSGKSTAGNMIFDDPVFESKLSTSSVTRVSQKHTGDVNNRSVTLIDTPDFRFSTHADFDSDSELKRSLELCSPGAHVILLLLPLSTFTQQEMDFFRWFEQTFGPEVIRFTIVLFTQENKPHMRTLGELIKENTDLSAFISRCGQRYHEFNINAPADRQQVTELMEKVDSLVSDNRNSCYTLEMMLENDRRREAFERGEREREEKKRQSILDIIVNTVTKYRPVLQIILKLICIILCFAVVTGVLWMKDFSVERIFKGFIKQGSAEVVNDNISKKMIKPHSNYSDFKIWLQHKLKKNLCRFFRFLSKFVLVV